MPVPETIGVLRKSLKDMEIGDYIACHYQATSGAVGTFSRLGSDMIFGEIPSTGNGLNAPNAGFYLLKVDKGLLIADRVIQNSIPWGILDTGLLIQGKQLPPIREITTTLTTSASYGMGISPDGNLIAAGNDSVPHLSIFKKSGDTFTLLPRPLIMPAGPVRTIVFSPDGKFMVVGHHNVPYVTIYKVDGDTFTKQDDLGILSHVNQVSASIFFSNDSKLMVVGLNQAPFLSVYKVDGDVFTKLPSPSELPTSAVNGVTFSFDKKFLVITQSSLPSVIVYKIDGEMFTRLLDVPEFSTTANIIYGVSFSHDNKHMVLALTLAPFIAIYKIDGDTFTKLPNPSRLPPSASWFSVFSNDDRYMSISSNNTPYITTYRRDGDIFTMTPTPASVPTGQGQKIAFSPDNSYLYLSSAGPPYFTIYKSMLGITARSLSGGVSWADADNKMSITSQTNGAFPSNNEWDTYIIKSNLNEKVIPNSNNVWQHQTLVSWCQETPLSTIGLNTERTLRGPGSYSNYSKITSAINHVSIGFRPVFEYYE